MQALHAQYTRLKARSGFTGTVDCKAAESFLESRCSIKYLFHTLPEFAANNACAMINRAIKTSGIDIALHFLKKSLDRNQAPESRNALTAISFMVHLPLIS